MEGEKQGKYMFPGRFSLITSILSMIFLALAACAHVEMDKVSAEVASSVRFKSQANGLLISIDPYMEEERLVRFFGVDLLSRGVLPLLIYFKNVDAEDGYVLLHEKSTLLMRSSDSEIAEGNENRTDDQNLKTQESQEKGNSVTGFAAASGIAAVGLTPPGMLMFAFSQTAHENEELISRNIEDKKIMEKTVYPGDSQSGFIYFQLEKREAVEDLVAVHLEVRNIRTGEIISFLVEISEH
jgi:hypothetical protein